MALVTRVIGDCPKCGMEKAFGNINVYSTFVLRGCVACTYKEEAWLPPVIKRVLYLDQFFFSKAFRAGDSRFTEAQDLISRLTALQLLVVPYSSVHEDETYQWAEKHHELIEFIKSSARGHEFKRSYEVQHNQIFCGFRAWLAGDGSSYCIDRKDALPKDIDAWESYFRIDVGGYYKDANVLRELKGRSIEGLVDLFDGWRVSTTSFDQDLLAEQAAAGKAYIDLFIEFAARIAVGDFSALSMSPIMSKVVEGMLHLVPEEVPKEQRLRKCAEFLFSDPFRELPYQRLNARILAAMKALVKAGAYPKRERALEALSGFFFDVEHVATYAPYVDGIVLDKTMAELVSKPTVDLEGRYGVRVFSLNNWTEFLDWLHDIETNGMTPEHRAGLSTVYPETTA
jgi:hypothetical protein